MSTAETNADLDSQILFMDARRGARLMETVCAFLGRFVSYPTEHARVAHAFWIAHTHMMQAWESTPRLAFLSAEPASGKTRALEITELLVPNPVQTVNVSPAYLFRKVGSEEGATILFDEIDTVFGARAKDNEDIRGLLNAGHRRGATTGRCVVRGKNIQTEEIPAYAAVAVAGLGWLPDTLLSRSIIIRMRRRHAGEHVEGFRRRLHASEGWAIRDGIATWASSVATTIKWPDLPTQIADRDADVWEPLIAIADAAGGEWPDRVRAAAVALVADTKDLEPSPGIRLLSDLRAVFGSSDELPSKAILQALHALEEAPWADIKGKPLNERGLASRLRQYNVRSKTVRIGTTTPKGYARADLVDVWARYLQPPAPDPGATGATQPSSGRERSSMVAAVALPPPGIVDVADAAPVGGTEPTCGHCKLPGGALCEASDAGKPLLLHPECVDGYFEAGRVP